jgi:cytochrome c oxidase subunit IV
MDKKAPENGKKTEAFRIGFAVFILLAFMTVGEYLIGAYVLGWTAPLVLIAIIKAALIVRDYMHLPRLFSGEEEAHS